MKYSRELYAALFRIFLGKEKAKCGLRNDICPDERQREEEKIDKDLPF